MQKHIISLLFIIFVSSIAFTANPTVSAIESITIFRNGAQVKRKATISVSPGQNEVTINGISYGFDESTITVSVPKDVEIGTVTFKRNFDTEGMTTKSPFISKLKELGIKKENEQIIYDTWKEEENLLLLNKKIEGPQILVADQVQKMAEMYRTRLLEVKQKMLESRLKLVDLEAEIAKITNEQNEWFSSGEANNMGSIILTLQSNISGNIPVYFGYIDYRAGWTTNFDLRLENLSQPILLVNKAKIYQNTGESWNNISLTLTTGNSNNNIIAPKPEPWFLHYTTYAGYRQDKEKAMHMDAAQLRAYNIRPEVAETDQDGIRAEENITFLEYKIPNLVSIPSDGKGYDFKLKENEMPAKFHYFSAPCKDVRAYLIASIDDWHQYNLSSGDMRLYFEGTYIGTSYLDASATGDTLTLSLGPDIAINVKKEKITEYSKTKMLSSKKQISAGWEITVRNNKSTEMEITVVEQVPLSTSSDMEIEIEELSGAKYDVATGMVEWKLRLKPGEKTKKKLLYHVKIPKSQTIRL